MTCDCCGEGEEDDLWPDDNGQMLCSLCWRDQYGGDPEDGNGG